MRPLLPLLASVVLLSPVVGVETPTAVLSRSFPVQGALEQNPYAQAVLSRVPSFLREQVPAADEAGVLQVMPKYTDLRRYADQTQAIAWAWLTPGTPHHRKPEVLATLVARLDLLTASTRGGTFTALYPAKKDNHYNVFLLESFAWTVQALVGTAEADLPAASVERWRAFIRTMLAYQRDDREGHEHNGEFGIIPNIDLRYLVAITASAKALAETNPVETVNHLLEATRRAQLPGGAFRYYAGSNECFCYHESNLRDLTRYYWMSGDTRALDLLHAARPFYALAIGPQGVIEYTTAPPWKSMWNGSGKTVGPQIAAFFNNDPVLRGIARDEDRRNPGYPLAYLSDLLIAMGVHEAAGPTAPQPEGIVDDPNIGGVRGRFGRFAATIDGRDHRSPHAPVKSLNEARARLEGASLGKPSWVGATITRDQVGRGALDSALLRVYPAVTFDAKRPFWMGSATQSDGLPGTVVRTADRAAVAGRYGIGSARPGPTYVPLAGWVGMEAWYLSRERLVGYLELETTAPATVEAITARIAVGFGRTGNDLVPKTIQATGPAAWRYGDLQVRVLASTFGPERIDAQAPYFREESKTATEIILGGAVASPVTVAAGDRREALVEVSPVWASPVEAPVLSHDGGLTVLTVEGGAAQVRVNPGAEAVELTIPAGYQAQPTPAAGATTLSVPSGGVVLLVRTQP